MTMSKGQCSSHLKMVYGTLKVGNARLQCQILGNIVGKTYYIENPIDSIKSLFSPNRVDKHH